MPRTLVDEDHFGGAVKGELPGLSREEFAGQLAGATACPLDGAAIERLWVHYCELRRWNRRLSLIGPGTAGTTIERHYAESLAASELLRAEDRVVVDCGSGAGFPGWVIAATDPSLEMTLIEARERKWSFLEQVSAKAALKCRCLNARVSAVVPEGFPLQVDVVLVRAVRLARREVSAMIPRLASRGRFLLWSGEKAPMALDGLKVARRVPISNSHSRQILEVVRED